MKWYFEKKGSWILSPSTPRWIYKSQVVHETRSLKIIFFSSSLLFFSGRKPIKVHVRFVWWIIRKKLLSGVNDNNKSTACGLVRDGDQISRSRHALITHIRVGWMHGKVLSCNVNYRRKSFECHLAKAALTETRRMIEQTGVVDTGCHMFPSTSWRTLECCLQLMSDKFLVISHPHTFHWCHMACPFDLSQSSLSYCDLVIIIIVIKTINNKNLKWISQKLWYLSNSFQIMIQTFFW